MSDETNHGWLDDGRIWARFCSNPDCHILGCPGDCTPSPSEAPPVTFAELHREIAARDQEIQRLRAELAIATAPEGWRPGRAIGNFRQPFGAK